MTIVALALVNWLVTLILVESDLFCPLREWIENRRDGATFLLEEAALEPAFHPGADRRLRVAGARDLFWRKVSYLCCCHLCAGTWVGLLLASLVPARPLGSGPVGWFLAGLLIKAGGHVTLEATALLKRIAKTPEPVK